MNTVARDMLVAGFGLGFAIGLVGGCANQTTRDLEDVPVIEPDKAEFYVNIDKYPNINRICIDGVAFATTTREYQSLVRVPEWDKSWCAQ